MSKLGYFEQVTVEATLEIDEDTGKPYWNIWFE